VTRTLSKDAAEQSRLRIGEWSVDPATNELGRADGTVRIEPKAMEVLVLLADRAGRVVSREELFAIVWPGVVVGDEALTQSIIKLRKALGDNPRAPSYIETISKRGYRLIAPVVHVGASSAARATAVAPHDSPAQRRRRFLLPASVVAFLLAVAVGLFALLSVSKPGPDTIASEAVESSRQLLMLTLVPFEPLGGDGEQAYLARGIGNDLLTELSRVPGLRVISTSSPNADATASPGYLVSGSVQRAADTLRITIHLRDTQSGQQLWAERFERPFGELFAVQDEIVNKLTALLPGKIAEAAREQRARRHTHSLEAYDLLLRGQALFLVRQIDTNEEARRLYRKALELDPKFARAYAGLAMTYAMDAALQWSVDPSPSLARARELAETARQIDPDSPEVHWALGFVHLWSRRHEQALQSLRRAIELNRSFADAYAFIGGIHAYSGEAAKTVPLVRNAMRLNPDGGYLYYLILGRAYLFENDVEQALINLREAAARNPVNLETRIHLAATLVAAGDIAGAQWQVEEIRALEPSFALGSWLDASPLTSRRYRERLVALLGQAGVE